VRRTIVLVGVAAVALAAAQAPPAKLARITVIGDSVATAMAYEPTAKRLLGQGVDARLEFAVCRRTAASSCPYKGERPLTVIELVKSAGSALGPVVVVAVGYNDYVETYRDDVEEALHAMRKAGVSRVLWLTLRAERQSYLAMNDDLGTLAKRFPELTVVDWNAASRSNPGWVQDDGIHVTNQGAVEMATLIHRTLAELGVALPQVAVQTNKLPWAKRSQDYVTRLTATGGSPPYRWVSLTRAPRGLHLTAAGKLFGIPRTPGLYALSFRVEDAQGTTATQSLRLKVVS
jgi:lysophospholipase L1-like esterase